MLFQPVGKKCTRNFVIVEMTLEQKCAQLQLAGSPNNIAETGTSNIW
jgi:hypothetical protein